MKAKMRVAQAALQFIENGMIVGLGSGSTARIFVNLLGEKIHSGQLRNIVGIPTSDETSQQARTLGISLGKLADYTKLDIAVDGADEVDPNLNLIKGWGGALVREKLVELYAERFVVMVDDAKLVERLGTRGPLPVEVSQFAWQAQAAWLAKTLGCTVTRRERETGPYVTDNHNFILQCFFEKGIINPALVCEKLSGRPGLVGHGLFLNMATQVLVGTSEAVNILTRESLSIEAVSLSGVF